MTTFGKCSGKIIYKTIEKLLTNTGRGCIIKVEIKERATARKELKMKAFKGYYTDNNGNLYELKEKVSTGAIFYEVEWIYKKGFARTDRTVFFSHSDIKQLKLN